MLDLDAQKKVAEISKLNVDKWKTVVSLAVGAASTVGVVAIFIYCFFVAHFFPSGLKIGDTLFFVFAMLGLSLTGMVLSGFGMRAKVPWENRKDRTPVREKARASKGDPNKKKTDIDNVAPPVMGKIETTDDDTNAQREDVENVASLATEDVEATDGDANEQNRKNSSVPMLATGEIQKPTSSFNLKNILINISPHVFLMIFILGSTLCVRQFGFVFFDPKVTNFCVRYAWLLVALDIFIGYIACSWLLCPDFKEIVWSVLPGLFFSFIIGFLTIFFSDFWSAFSFVAGLMLGGLFVAMGLDLLNIPLPKKVEDLESSRRARNIASTLIFIGIFIPYVACGINGQLLNYVIGSLGVYTEHATLVVNKSEFGKLQATANAKGILLNSCRLDDEHTAISQVRIWWHGIGERSYIELGAFDDSKENSIDRRKSVRIELDSAGVTKAESQINISCRELRRGIYFDSKKSELKDDQWKLAAPIVKKFLEKKKPDDYIMVVGFADPRPIQDGSNFKLAHDRACNVYSHLSAENKSKVLIDVRGDMEGMILCNSKDDVDRERDCEERNRRVELQVVDSGVGEVLRSSTASATDSCN